MYLVLKRFPLDDVPIGLRPTKSEALELIAEDGPSATPEQERIMKTNIDNPAVTYLVVEFDGDGKPARSETHLQE
jgi:hypothetical protein